MNREEARRMLENYDCLFCGHLHFVGKYSNCVDGCCEEVFNTIDETLDHIEHLCQGNWNKVTK